MGDHLALERYYWFHNQVRTGRFPNANTLAEQFEISPSTAHEPKGLHYSPMAFTEQGFAIASRTPKKYKGTSQANLEEARGHE